MTVAKAKTKPVKIAVLATVLQNLPKNGKTYKEIALLVSKGSNTNPDVGFIKNVMPFAVTLGIVKTDEKGVYSISKN